MSFLFAAFTAIWVVLFLYLLSLSRRQQALSRELDAVRQVVEKSTPGKD